MTQGAIFSWLDSPSGPRPPHCRDFVMTLRQITFGTTPLDEWSARRRDRYVTTHNTHKRTEIHAPAIFEPAIPASERPQTRALDRAATGIGTQGVSLLKYASVFTLSIYVSPPHEAFSACGSMECPRTRWRSTGRGLRLGDWSTASLLKILNFIPFFEPDINEKTINCNNRLRLLYTGRWRLAQ